MNIMLNTLFICIFICIWSVSAEGNSLLFVGINISANSSHQADNNNNNEKVSADTFL